VQRKPGLAPRYGLAKRKAEALLEEAKIKKPPVPVEELARRAGLVLKFEPFVGKAMSGMLHRGARGGVVGVNSLDSATRQRFTIAHELGHFLLHAKELHIDEGYSLRFRNALSSKGVDDDEIEANQFASHLLMPASLMEEDVRKLGRIDVDDGEAIETLAKRYEVSPQAMTLRLAKLLAHGL
jgi:Zn-dependent peptidase ImmA (M78 family)